MTLKQYIGLIREIPEYLNERRMALLRSTCFGPWLELEDDSPDPLLVLMFLQCQVQPDNVGEDEMYFDVCGHIHRFSREDFCLITGFRFGPIPTVNTRRHGLLSTLRGNNKITSRELLHWFYTIGDDDRYSDEEAVRITLLTMASTFFLGQQGTVKVPDILLTLIDDLPAWNNFPWGSYFWTPTYTQMNGAIQKRKDQRKLAMTLTGFLFAFKVSYFTFSLQFNWSSCFHI